MSASYRYVKERETCIFLRPDNFDLMNLTADQAPGASRMRYIIRQRTVFQRTTEQIYGLSNIICKLYHYWISMSYEDVIMADPRNQGFNCALISPCYGHLRTFSTKNKGPYYLYLKYF